MGNLYILKTISIKPKTHEYLLKEHQVYNLKYDRNDSYDEFIKYITSWDENRFEYNEEDNCYFTDLETAKHYAQSNMADMNDGGCYDYVAIVELPFDKAYAFTDIEDMFIFKFNYKTDSYEEIVLWRESEEVIFIAKKNHWKYFEKEIK